MPLARIITPLPEYFERLAQDLRARGFDIETANPGQFYAGTPDLEITVKQCAPEDAGKLAAASGKDMCVLMAPGARNSGIRSIEMIVLQPKAEVAEPARHFVTPAQVIEISTALIAPEGTGSQQDRPTVEEKPRHWPKAKIEVRSSWDEIAKTTAHWMEIASAACQAAWEKLRSSNAPAKAFFMEVGEETRKLGKRVSETTVAFVRRAKKNGADQDEQLVPSLFDFSEELSSEELSGDEDKPVIEMPKRQPARIDKRFWKSAGVAAVAAVAVLFAVSVVQRPRHVPAVLTEAPVANKAALPASASLKPSAMVESGTAKGPVRMVSTKQVIHSEASDTVVRYGNRPVKQKPADGHPGIKRYSDLD